MNWYAVQTQPNRENLAVLYLERQGFDVWLPCCERIVRHARQIKRVRRPLFQGIYSSILILIQLGGVASTVLSASKALLALDARHQWSTMTSSQR